MLETEVPLRRLSVVSSRPFDEVVRRLTHYIGRPDPAEFRSAIGAATSPRDLQAVVDDAVGPSDLMEFVRFDMGEILRKALGVEGRKILRLVIGNPLIMKEMVKSAPDAASYAPVTILIDERADGVHLSYDTMASLLAFYENGPALSVARDLDAKIASLLETAAG